MLTFCGFDCRMSSTVVIYTFVIFGVIGWLNMHGSLDGLVDRCVDRGVDGGVDGGIAKDVLTSGSRSFNSLMQSLIVTVD